MGLDPTAVNTGYVHNVVAPPIDQRISGKNPANAIQLYSLQDHANTNYVRNTNCWAADLDLTCASPWNSHLANKRPGTLISPRHIIVAHHYLIGVGHTIRFVDATNGVVTRTVSGYQRIGETDIGISILDNDVPTNRISFAQVLPPGFSEYLGNGARLPVIMLDQEEKARVGNIKSLSPSAIYGLAHFVKPLFGDRAAFYEGLIGGDSGNPCLLLVNETPVVLTTWWGAGSGPPVAEFYTSINAAMETLSNAQGTTNGYQLTAVDLTGFIKIGSSVGTSEEDLVVVGTVDGSGPIPMDIVTYTTE